MIISTLLCAMVLGGVLALSSNLIGSADDAKLITMAEAEQLALSEVNGKVVEIEKEKQGTKVYYEIEVETNDAEYDIKIDAITGEIVKKTKGQLLVNGVVQNIDSKTQVNRDDQDDKLQRTSQSEKTVTTTTKSDDKQTSQTPIVKTSEKQTTQAPAVKTGEKQGTPIPTAMPKQRKHDDDDWDDDDDDDDDWDDDDDDDDDWDDDDDDDNDD